MLNIEHYPPLEQLRRELLTACLAAALQVGYSKRTFSRSTRPMRRSNCQPLALSIMFVSFYWERVCSFCSLIPIVHRCLITFRQFPFQRAMVLRCISTGQAKGSNSLGCTIRLTCSDFDT